MKPAAFRRELANLRRTAQADEALLPALPEPDESMALAREMAATFAALVKSYAEMFDVPQEEAVARVGELDPAREKRILTGPPDQVQWHDLNSLARRDPELARRRWEEIKQAARQELESGHRAAQALGSAVSGCWQTAQFLAVRNGLAEAWRPRNGLEWQLIDTMAQAQTLMRLWQENLVALTLLVGRADNPDPERPDHPLGRRLTEAARTEEAAAMVERWHRLFLKTLGALQDLRRRPPVVVRRAGQVNIAGQQVNVAR
jgi:hypothetical protein